ncbi:hemoglobin/transferrin/lactoferrin receptor protein [Epibacterium ulvae]|uniref:Hemoglobin/transferrin/lactoferrin receptor protein n=1 Tax=Epibacterium ulvae TaxID=1156985 RepID=A0A1G5QT75_9RHOB|nr:TonB-dependent receptor [Epibacterium ulvae]SCZ64750.1 hemoglobin/transferrin/lactoferrin receptor protein [Epibacterium ulvae]
MAQMTRSLLPGLLCGTALTLSFAQSALADEDTIYSLDPIIVEKRDAEYGAADRATAVYVADAEIERASFGDLKDLFAGIASVSVGGAVPVAQKIFVNGVDMLNLAITVDGVSQNNRVFHHASANVFDPSLMKSVRVDSGVAAADSGPGALAGGVIMETVDAEDILEEGDNFGGKFRLGYSDNGKTAQAALTLAGRSNGFEILAYTRRANGENYDDGNGEEVTGTEADLTSHLLKLAYESDEGHRVELSAQELNDGGLRNARANFGYRPARGPFPDLRVYDTRRRIVSLRYENTQATGLWDPSVVFGYSSTSLKTPVPFGDDAKSSTFSTTLKNTFNLGGENTITAGVDYQDKNNRYSGNWITDRPFEESQNLGLFAQARFEPTERFKISAGARMDWQDFTDRNGGEQSHNGLSGNLSLTYDFTDELTGRAAYSSVFGGIILEDNYLLGDAWDYSGLTDASRGKNLVVGLDWQRNNWTLGGEYFRTQINDARFSSYDGGAAAYTASHNDFEARGFNLAATYGWDSGFARFTASKSENYINGAKASSFYVLDYGAPLGTVLALEVQQELPQYNLVIGGNIDAALSYNHNASESDPVSELAGYEVVNIFAEYTPPAADNVTIRAGIDNLFDRQFADRATYGGDYETFNTLKEPGRTISLVATVKF